MANPRIEVEIGANVAGLATGVNTATSQLDKLGKAAQATAPQIQRLSQATSGYNSIGTDFARIIQDAPFGIIGVGNNITQLAGSFQVLKNQTGSTSAALKQSFASIFSSGNALVLGISLLTTAFTVLQQNGFFKTEKSAKSLQDTLQDYRDTLDSVTRASIEGQANAAKEIQSFALLRAQAENTNVSLENRIEAVKDLKKQYPEYLKGLTDEQILTGQVGEAYTKLTAGLIATAKARAASDQIAKNSLDVLTLITQEEDRALQIKQIQIERSKVLADADRQNARDRGDYLVKAEGLQRNINNLEEENKKSQEERNKIAQQEIKLTDAINQGIAQGAIFTKESAAAKGEDKKALDAYKDSWDEYNLSQETASILTNKLTSSTKEYEKAIANVLTRNESIGLIPEVTGDNAWDQYTYSIYQFRDASIQANAEITETSTKALEFSNNLSKISGQEVKIKTNFDEFGNELADVDKSKLSAFVVRLAEFNSQVAGVIQNGAQQTLGDFAFAIGDALASGGNVVKAAGAALLGGLAGVLNQLGQLAIGTGLAIAGIKKALQTLNPAVAIGAGVALIALAGFVSSKAKSLGSSNGSGGGGGGGASSVGDSGVGGGSSFVGGGAQGGMFAQNRDVSGEFVVRGQDLVYVLGQSENRINKG
jgi:uncharacterized membrane protein YgcG